MYEKFNENIKILLGQLFNVDKWDEYIDKNLDKDFEDFLAIRENSDSIMFSYKNSQIDEEEDDKESENKKEEEGEKSNSIKNESINHNEQESREPIFSFHRSHMDKEINTSIKKDKEKKLDLHSNKSDSEFFLQEFDDGEYENLFFFQLSLYNLRFIYVINQYFKYINFLAENKSELVGDLSCIEETLIIIYKLLIAFIHNNDSHLSVIKNRLYLYLCPLKLKKLSSDLSYSISKFLYHLVSDFKSTNDYGKISHIDEVLNNIYLLHQIDWSLHKKAMRFFAEILLIFFEYSSSEYIYLIFQLLEDIKEVVINDIIADINNNNK